MICECCVMMIQSIIWWFYSAEPFILFRFSKSIWPLCCPPPQKKNEKPNKQNQIFISCFGAPPKVAPGVAAPLAPPYLRPCEYQTS